MVGEQCFSAQIADLHFTFQCQDSRIFLDRQGSIQAYCIDGDVENSDYLFSYAVRSVIDLFDYQLTFRGEPISNDFLNYSWYVYTLGEKVAIRVEFKDHSEIKSVLAEFEKGKTQVKISLVLKTDCHKAVRLDPLMHPLGSLLMLYLVQEKQGLLIHASAIEDGGQGILFTGVSGIGKSTMARLWGECGACVLNDDRLVLRLFDREVRLYNNPMPYYKQAPKQSILKKIFLLKQSPLNYIQPLKGVQAYSRVLGNFIQQFYEPAMVKKHLDIAEEIIAKVAVYEVGFKPDTDIVRMMREMDRYE
ncbi:SynChlorMet cassette protein ScmC [Saccharicrinis fermentans DSM 9555 = JCM 21142]|uniref:SynChlorMet cassette protein ScmC n=2 Tax=Saccharicrinis fermentans TaxID=982 RepID=W7Y9H0_9BACT|nr:SynChlorMet cassette protein ScmC [Saccharicrinis fermentans DSM 9555 = JCM 21142]